MSNSIFITQLLKFLFFVIIIAAIIMAISYYLGYWKEDVWKQDPTEILNIQKLDSYF
jgi:L-asparagine transporter-like permease